MDLDLEKIQEQLDELAKRFGLTNKQLAGLAMVAGKSSNDFKTSVNSLVTDVNKTDQSYKDMLRSVKEMDKALSKLTDSEEDKLRKDEILAERSRVSRQATMVRLNSDVEQFGQVLVNKTTSAVGDFTKGLQAGASANSLATGILRGAVDIAASGFKAVTTGIQAVGESIPIIGGVISGIGKVANAASEAARQLSQFAITVLSAELDRTTTAFQKVTQVGAGFTEGMTGMRNSAGNAQLTLEEFSNVLVRQADNIAKSGLGFEGAMQRASGVQNIFSASQNQVRDQLLKLGFGFEEQGDLIFETMSDMRRGGLLQRSSDAEIAIQTQKYATNLRFIAGITGEDARKKMAAARDQMQNMAVQQKILEMQKSNPEAYQKIRDAVSLLPEGLQKGALQLMVTGNVIDKVTNVVMAQTPAIKTALMAVAATVNDGNIGVTESNNEVARQRGLIAEGMVETMGVTGQIGRAALLGVGGDIAEISKLNSSIYNEVAGQDLKTGERVRGGLEKQMTTTNELTTEVTAAMHAAQKMKIIIQDELLGVLGKYAEATKVALGLFQDMITKLTGRDKPDEEKKLDANKQSLRQMQDDSGQNWLARLTGTADTDEMASMKKEIRAAENKKLLERLNIGGTGRSNKEDWGQFNSKLNNNGTMTPRAVATPQDEEITTSTHTSWVEKPQLNNATPEESDRVRAAIKEQNANANFSTGGVASGPISGYSATLHGTEAVVPLPDGASIPVTMKSPTSSGEAQTQMIDVLQNQLSELRQQTALTYDMLKSMDKGNRTQNKILTAGY